MSAFRDLLRHGLAGVAFSMVVTALMAPPAYADSLQDAAKLLKQAQYPQALEQIDHYVEANPRDAQGWFIKGVILTEMNRTQEAVAVFTKLTEEYPELPEPYNNLAVIYAQQKQYDKARQELEMAIRTHPSYATAHENLGDIYARLASQAYDKALQLDSSNTTAQTKLAMIRELMSVAPHSGRAAAPVSTPISPMAPVPAPAVTSPPAAEAPNPPPAAIAAAPEPKQPALAAPTSVPEAPPASSTASDEIARSMDAWASAWSAKDVKAYLSCYAPNFKTPGGMSRSAWEAERRNRIGKPGVIQVSIENLSVTADGPDRATVKFRQHYRSASLKSSSTKLVIMVRVNGKWLIQQERIGN